MDGLFELVELAGDAGERVSGDGAEDAGAGELGWTAGGAGGAFGLEALVFIAGDVEGDGFRERIAGVLAWC